MILHEIQTLINGVLQQVAAEEAEARAMNYCDMLDDEWLAAAMASNPRFFGPDRDWE